MKVFKILASILLLRERNIGHKIRVFAQWISLLLCLIYRQHISFNRRLLTAYFNPLTIYNKQPTTNRLPQTAYRKPPTTNRQPLTAYHKPPTTNRLPLTCLPLTAYHKPSTTNLPTTNCLPLTAYL